MSLLAYPLIVLIAIVILGYLLTFIKLKLAARISGWLFVILSTTAIAIASRDLAPFSIMLLVIFCLLFSIKSVVCIEAQQSGHKRLAFMQYLGFTTGWLGMRPYIFLTLGGKSIPGGFKIISHGVIRIVVGTILIIGAVFLSDKFKIGATLFFLVGLSFILHFGLTRIQTGFWRLLGVNTQVLFREPYKSKSLSEFWSQRWNLAFSEMTSIAVLRPAKSVLGHTGAVWVCFLISGIFHELAISFPVNKGYGLPTLFFLLHALAMALENKTFFKELSSIKKRAWTISWLIIPAPLLFHTPFIEGVIWPAFDFIKSNLYYR